MDATTKAACSTPDKRFVDLNMIVRGAADPIAFRSNHSGAELVEKLKGSLVGLDAELALELDGADPGGIRCDQIGSPKPHAQSSVRILHDRSRCKPVIALATSAPQDVRPVGKAVWLARIAAPLAYEAIRPADSFQVCRTGSIVREYFLELGKCPRDLTRSRPSQFVKSC